VEQGLVRHLSVSQPSMVQTTVSPQRAKSKLPPNRDLQCCPCYFTEGVFGLPPLVVRIVTPVRHQPLYRWVVPNDVLINHKSAWWAWTDYNHEPAALQITQCRCSAVQCVNYFGQVENF
jgi:hypothetical protein